MGTGHRRTDTGTDARHRRPTPMPDTDARHWHQVRLVKYGVRKYPGLLANEIGAEIRCQ